MFEDEDLGEFNEGDFRWVIEVLGLPNVGIVRSSTLAIEAVGTERLVQIVQNIDGTRYVCGAGAAGYQEDSMFNANGIDLRPLEFTRPSCLQCGVSSVVPGLSIVDCVMNGTGTKWGRRGDAVRGELARARARGLSGGDPEEAGGKEVVGNEREQLPAKSAGRDSVETGERAQRCRC